MKTQLRLIAFEVGFEAFPVLAVEFILWIVVSLSFRVLDKVNGLCLRDFLVLFDYPWKSVCRV